MFILDDFDQIKNLYENKNNEILNIYQRFSLDKWNAKYIITCRSQMLNDAERMIFSINQEPVKTIYLSNFSKQQTNNYIKNFCLNSELYNPNL